MNVLARGGSWWFVVGRGGLWWLVCCFRNDRECGLDQERLSPADLFLGICFI